MTIEKQPIAIGVVRKPHGIAGECCVSGFGDTLSALDIPAKVLLGKDAQAARVVEISRVRRNPKGFICRFVGCDDMNAAEGLRDQLLFCDSGDLPALDKKRHYGFELEGMTVVAEEDGAAVGTVTVVESYPTVDCLEVRRENGITVDISMTPGVVRFVDKENGRIVVSRSAIEELLG